MILVANTAAWGGSNIITYAWIIFFMWIVASATNLLCMTSNSISCAWIQGRSQTFSFGGATGGAGFATRGAVNGLCRTFRKRPEKFWGGHWGARQNFWGKWPPWHTPSSAPGYLGQNNLHAFVRYWASPSDVVSHLLQNLLSKCLHFLSTAVLKFDNKWK